ncbi:MAG: metabolite traffic protein EboE [Propionibacteriales bacterium]|nr:metabolite traffic protein EboE [Propionibacteriales bacterium]
MRFRHPDSSTVHLAYCTNVHPAEDLDGVVAQLEGCASDVRAELGVPVLGVGLWLAHDLAALLARDPASLKRLAGTLDDCGLEAVTLNGFPYAGFHDEVVGKKVYLPDWSQPERLAYTLDLVEVLAQLMPADAAYGSISTLPLGWRTPWYADRDRRARDAVAQLANRLQEVEQRTGRVIRVGLEPEPGCVIETNAQVADWLSAYDDSVRDGVLDRVGGCVDTCHLAVQFEQPAQVFADLETAGVSVVKSQVSAALHVPDPADAETRVLLAEFAEPRFLHQTREGGGRRLRGVDDLSETLDPAARRQLPGRHPWRVHFHVPVHAAPQPPLTATTDVLSDALTELVGGEHPRTHHLESETYTWSVLPERQRPSDGAELAAGIAGELGWLRDRLVSLGLEPVG